MVLVDIIDFQGKCYMSKIKIFLLMKVKDFEGGKINIKNNCLSILKLFLKSE